MRHASRLSPQLLTHQLFKYDYIYIVTSLEAIMSELGSADSVRTIKDTPSPSNLHSRTANAINDSVSRM